MDAARARSTRRTGMGSRRHRSNPCRRISGASRAVTRQDSGEPPGALQRRQGWNANGGMVKRARRNRRRAGSGVHRRCDRPRPWPPVDMALADRWSIAAPCTLGSHSYTWTDANPAISRRGETLSTTTLAPEVMHTLAQSADAVKTLADEPASRTEHVAATLPRPGKRGMNSGITGCYACRSLYRITPSRANWRRRMEASTAAGSCPSSTAMKAAVPAACPVTIMGGITRICPRAW